MLFSSWLLVIVAPRSYSLLFVHLSSTHRVRHLLGIRNPWEETHHATRASG